MNNMDQSIKLDELKSQLDVRRAKPVIKAYGDEEETPIVGSNFAARLNGEPIQSNVVRHNYEADTVVINNKPEKEEPLEYTGPGMVLNHDEMTDNTVGSGPKYGVGLSGCLTPFLQLPIFIAFYETLRRIPSTRMSYVVENNISIAKLPLNFDFLKGNFFGLDLFSGKTENFSDPQTWGIWVLAILVGATQILSQILINNRQKRQKEAMQSDIPQYRRPEQTEQQKQTETMMKMMLYGMPLMMVVFIISSPAALGLYWLVGNVYSTLQSYLGSKNSSNRLEMLRAKMNK